MTNRLIALCVLSGALMACNRADPSRQRDEASNVPAAPERFDGIGRIATASEIQPWDIDVNPTGRGLPAGHGTYAEGAKLFAAKCAACHGPHGEGMAVYPKLIGREPRADFPFGRDPTIAKTIGNYWPYSTTLFDYVRRAMPLSAPGSLTTNEVYDAVAFLLAANEITPRDAVIDQRTLPAVRMPARDRFVRDDRRGGPGFR